MRPLPRLENRFGFAISSTPFIVTQSDELVPNIREVATGVALTIHPGSTASGGGVGLLPR